MNSKDFHTLVDTYTYVNRPNILLDFVRKIIILTILSLYCSRSVISQNPAGRTGNLNLFKHFR